MSNKLHKIHTIYDLVIYAYERINGKSENQILSRYLESTPKYCEQITFLLREVLYCNLTVEEFVKNIADYLERDFEQVCMHILLEFNRYYDECDKYPLISERFTKVIEEYSIQNNISSQFAFYPMSQRNFIMESNVMVKARVHRNRAGIWDAINSYRINKIENSENSVLIKKYKNDGIEQVIAKKSCLSLAVIPFSNRKPFQENDRGILQYKEYSDEENEKIYQACIALLKDLDENGIDIIVFPEIVMTEKLITRIKRWLQINAIQKTNLKLIFMGSYYVNDVNRCKLFSGTGKELLSNDKQNGFEYCDMEKNPHREELGDKSDIIYLIDIKGLGRVWYLICKDAIIYNHSVNIIEKYDCNVRIVSAYSNSISDFQTAGDILARGYEVFSVVCNSCAVRRGKNIGVISYPVFYNEGKNISSREKTYACDVNCKQCSYASCAHIWKFCVTEKEEEVSSKPTTGLAVKYAHYKNCKNIMT